MEIATTERVETHGQFVVVESRAGLKWVAFDNELDAQRYAQMSLYKCILVGPNYIEDYTK